MKNKLLLVSARQTWRRDEMKHFLFALFSMQITASIICIQLPVELFQDIYDNSNGSLELTLFPERMSQAKVEN